MYTLTHQNGKVNYGLKKFIVDSVEDIEKIPTISLLPGSTAFIPKSSKLYIYQDLHHSQAHQYINGCSLHFLYTIRNEYN